MASAMLSHRPPKARRPHISSGSASLLPRFPTTSSTNLTSERPPQASTSVSASASHPLSSHTTTDLMDESLLDFDQLLVQSSHASHPGEGAPTRMMMSSNLFDEGSSMLNDAQMSFLHHDEEFTMVVREREDNNMDPDDTRQVPEAGTREQRHVEEREATSQGATANRVAPIEAAPTEALEEHIAQQPQPLRTASQESPIDTRLLDRSLPTNRRRSSISPILKRNAVVPLPALNENDVVAQPARASTKSKPSTSASSTSALPSILATTAASVRPVKPAHILPKDHPSHPRVIEATLIPIPRARERSRSRPTSSEPTLSRSSEAKAEAERKLFPLVSTQRSSASVSPITKLALPAPPLAPPPPPPPLPRSLPIGDYLAPLAEVSDEEAQSPQREDRLESFETTLPTPYRSSPPPACLFKLMEEQREDAMNQDGEEDLFELEMDVEGGNDDRYEALDADGSLPRIGESLKDFERHNRGNDRTAKTGRRMTTSTPAKAGVLSGVGRRASVVAAAGAARSAGLRKVVPEVLEQEQEEERDGGMMRPILPERYRVQSPFGSQSVTAVKEVKTSSTDRALPPPPKAPLPPPVASSSSVPRDPSLPQRRRASRAFEVGHHPPAVAAPRPQVQEPIPATTTASRRALTTISHPWPKASTSTKVSTRTPIPSIPTTRATEVAPPKTTLRLNYTYTRDPPTAQSVLTTIRLFDPCGPIHEETEGQQGLAPPEIERPRLPAKIGDLTVPMQNTFGARAEERERLRKEKKERMALGLEAEIGEGVRGGVKRGSSARGGERGNKRSKLDTGASSVDGGVLGTKSRQNLPSTTSAAATAPFKSTSTSTSTQPKPFTFTSLNRQRPAPFNSIAIHNPSSLQAQSEVALALNKASNLDRLGWSERQKLREEEVRRKKEMARKEEEEAERRKLKALKERLLQAKAPAVASGGATSGMRR
ncbi:BZ3500_MvSof-1268-A1-R1_Chr1-3g02339 [Microbotryum saponariae]|uniref:BZ3500_MvSof-1268-A1-R1_Chr1-3g02339 protein n=1 Tax=Microbotryum saponariae TaxID=289078 RepID=A0A2X0KIT7_9BASI|nr:BZ3500_MvSof-1268-A1-R1_Chr1-3g02339 [Microbotryum saponariae]SCZ96035.1 BZ3501_MvSof-1269-A2-R1_Chr1-3g01942 [Microbotryum saponariae]